MKKRSLLTATFILMLLLSVAAGTQFVNFARADIVAIYVNGGGISPQDLGAKPPTITIISPKNNKAYNPDNVTLALNVSVGNSTIATSRLIRTVSYKVDWQQSNIYVYVSDEGRGEFSTALNLTGINGTRIPEGKHNVTVYATEEGFYYEPPRSGSSYLPEIVIRTFDIDSSSSVSFTVDATSPSVSFLSMENKTYETSNVPLNFTVNESVSQITYSLDGQDNVTIAGNTTLTDLSKGDHNVTVYATDEAGNVGVSEIMRFNVEEPFPTTLVIASAITVAVVGIGLLVYLKKRKH